MGFDHFACQVRTDVHYRHQKGQLPQLSHLSTPMGEITCVYTSVLLLS